MTGQTETVERARPVILGHLEDPPGSRRAACSGVLFTTTEDYRDTPRQLCTGCYGPTVNNLRAAARAEAFAEIRRGVEGLAIEDRAYRGGWIDLIDRAAVLALLPSVPPDSK